MLSEINKALALALRDVQKLLRDKPRILISLIFPVIFIGVFGVTLDSGLGRLNLGFSYIDYVFSGIALQTLFQSTFSGIVSLIADREDDFAMGIFVAPVSRYSIVFGKIIGETIVAMIQLIGVVLFGLLIGVTFSPITIISALPVFVLACFVGAAFGVFISSRINEAENARRVFPFLIFPLIFLSGAFTPVNNLPPFLNALKSINPIYYGIDLVRSVLYAGRPEISMVTSNSFGVNLLIFLVLGLVFFVAGTFLFAQKEGNR